MQETFHARFPISVKSFTRRIVSAFSAPDEDKSACDRPGNLVRRYQSPHARITNHCSGYTLIVFVPAYFYMYVSCYLIISLCVRTRLYLEYKLCRLLLRTLDTRTARASSRGLRGYSRATSCTIYSPIGNYGLRPSSRSSNHSWPGMLMRHFGRRPLGSATSLPGMLNLGLEQNKSEDALGSLGKENESDKELEKEKNAEGEKLTGFNYNDGKL